MFNPSQEDVRRFFCTCWRKHLQGQVLTALEAMALDWILEHPEYHGDLADEEQALRADYSVERAKSNPFLHLSMHLAISEQLSIDQPPGIKGLVQALAQKRGNLHSASHEVMEVLGQIVWQAQRDGSPPNTERYLEALRLKLS